MMNAKKLSTAPEISTKLQVVLDTVFRPHADQLADINAELSNFAGDGTIKGSLAEVAQAWMVALDNAEAASAIRPESPADRAELIAAAFQVGASVAMFDVADRLKRSDLESARQLGPYATYGSKEAMESLHAEWKRIAAEMRAENPKVTKSVIIRRIRRETGCMSKSRKCKDTGKPLPLSDRTIERVIE